MSVKLAGDLQSGNVIMVDNQPVVVLKAQYNKSGRNAAVVKLRMKNLMTGRISELVYKADEKLEGSQKGAAGEERPPLFHAVACSMIGRGR